MKKAMSRVEDIRAESSLSDLGTGVRGEFFAEYQKGRNLACLSRMWKLRFPPMKPSMRPVFLVRLARATRRPTRRSSGRAAKAAARRST